MQGLELAKCNSSPKHHNLGNCQTICSLKDTPIKIGHVLVGTKSLFHTTQL